MKTYINTTAKVRNELPYNFDISCPQGHIDNYSPYDVRAEAGVSSAPPGLIIGSLLGAAIFGPFGALSGAVIFGSAGLRRDEIEREAVKRFNES